MRLFLDTNVVLDVIQKRKPHLRDSLWVLSRIEQGKDQGMLGGTTLTTIYYIIEKDPRLNHQQVLDALRSVLQLFEVISVGRNILETALDIDFPDYEDGVLHQAAVVGNADAIVTRDPGDFLNPKIPVYTPSELRQL